MRNGQILFNAYLLFLHTFFRMVVQIKQKGMLVTIKFLHLIGPLSSKALTFDWFTWSIHLIGLLSSKPQLKFRSYTPQTEELKERRLPKAKPEDGKLREHHKPHHSALWRGTEIGSTASVSRRLHQMKIIW